MPSPPVDMMWQELRVLKAKVCELEECCVTGTTTAVVVTPSEMVIKEGYPTSPTDSGRKGDVKVDNNYLYIAIEDNTWIRLRTLRIW